MMLEFNMNLEATLKLDMVEHRLGRIPNYGSTGGPEDQVTPGGGRGRDLIL